MIKAPHGRVIISSATLATRHAAATRTSRNRNKKAMRQGAHHPLLLMTNGIIFFGCTFVTTCTQNMLLQAQAAAKIQAGRPSRTFCS